MRLFSIKSNLRIILSAIRCTLFREKDNSEWFCQVKGNKNDDKPVTKGGSAGMARKTEAKQPVTYHISNVYK